MMVTLKKVLLLTIFLVFNSPKANQEYKNFCEQQFASNGKQAVEKTCLSFVLENAKGKLKLKSDASTTLGATSNALVLEDDKKSDLLAGDQTQLDSPVVINWDRENSEIYVLLKNGDINIYTDFVLGNVAPKRVIKNLELPGSTDFSVGQSKIATLNSDTNRIVLLKRDANSREKASKRKDQVVNTIELPESLTFSAIAYEESNNTSNKDTFYLATPSGDLYTIGSKGILKSMNYSHSANKVERLFFDAKKRALIIRTPSENVELKVP